MKDIKFLSVCKDAEEMIITLKDIFVQGNAKVEVKEDRFYLELKLVGISKKCVIKLTKKEEEIPKAEETKNKLE